jgi:hypothetical protein
MPAGTFNVDANGETTMLTSVPPNAGTFLLAAVTDEPGYVTSPTGSIQLASKPPTSNVQ